MTALILVTIALGLASGVTEGMAMVLPRDPTWTGNPLVPGGVRRHRWFPMYHLIDLVAYGMCAALAVLLWLSWPGWCVGVGLAILLWECREIGYSTARWLDPIPGHEHLTFADILSYNLEGRAVRSLHGARLLTATVLLIIGGVT